MKSTLPSRRARALFICLALAAAPLSAQILKNTNPGFENGLADWTTYKGSGIGTTAIIETRNAVAGFTVGAKHLFMRLPAEATNNQTQYITVGQSLALSSTKRYRYTVKLKWDNSENTLPSAIVSLWARNPDGSYNGRDQWLYNENVNTQTFEFTPNSTGNVFCYIGLLTHQDGFDDTDILVDSFRIEEIGDAAFDTDPRAANTNLLVNSTFGSDFANWTATYNNPNNVTGLNRSIVTVNGNKKMRLELPAAGSPTYLNNTWTGVYQTITLYAGNTYTISMRVDRVLPAATEYDTILNFYVYKPATSSSGQSWLGAVDYKFNRADEHVITRTVTPTETTTYHVTARVFGWGNDGRAFKVNVDDIQLERTP